MSDEEEDEDDMLDSTQETSSEYASSTVGEELDSIETWLEAMQAAVKAEQDQMNKVDSSVFS